MRERKIGWRMLNFANVKQTNLNLAKSHCGIHLDVRFVLLPRVPRYLRPIVQHLSTQTTSNWPSPDERDRTDVITALNRTRFAQISSLNHHKLLKTSKWVEQLPFRCFVVTSSDKTVFTSHHDDQFLVSWLVLSARAVSGHEPRILLCFLIKLEYGLGTTHESVTACQRRVSHCGICCLQRRKPAPGFFM